MDALKAIALCAYGHLKNGGWLMMEHGYDQSEQAVRLLESTGYRDISDVCDETGLARVIRGKK